jgi:hypothetical protein
MLTSSKVPKRPPVPCGAVQPNPSLKGGVAPIGRFLPIVTASFASRRSFRTKRKATAVMRPARGEPQGLHIGLAKKSSPISYTADHWHSSIISALLHMGKQEMRSFTPDIDGEIMGEKHEADPRQAQIRLDGFCVYSAALYSATTGRTADCTPDWAESAAA